MIKKFVILPLFLLLAIYANALSIITAKINIAGLTCSMCSYSVEQSILKLKFVASVEMDLNNNTALVNFNKEEINLNQLAKKVNESGFSVNKLTIFIDEIPSGGFTLNNTHYQLIGRPLGNTYNVLVPEMYKGKLVKKWKRYIPSKFKTLKNTVLLKSEDAN